MTTRRPWTGSRRLRPSRHRCWPRWMSPSRIITSPRPTFAGDRDSAIAHYRACRDIRELLAKDPKAKLSSLDLMLALARTGDHARASDIAEAMIKGPPLDARIYFHCACGFALSAGAAASLPPSAESAERVRHYTDCG